ncbi:argininosuccinate lyase [Streptococcus gallinaceus]|uniref:SHOCT domain-containing protein n=1 Tax=Streptococcus gallinaceus TaxID=165758 RepID=UPI00209EEC03|nr:SHOCT domain-containing protein [Streptococcus gallinaceus]MCP1638569.1 argininosuccinate lyase [Streptococcus gallinaceus]MCP1769344.1 argininosuccinate lyase [Streptococcus gallinaceus]
MFENEVNYRLAKFLVIQLYHQGLITQSESKKILKELLKWYNPEFQSVEVLEEKLGDGVYVGK